MIRILLPEKILKENKEALEEFININEIKNIVSIAPLSNEFQEVELPDFNDSLTRGVYSGMIHSFLPPRSYPYLILCAIEINHRVIYNIDEEQYNFFSRLLYCIETDTFSRQDRMLFCLICNNALIFMPIYAMEKLNSYSIRKIYHELNESKGLDFSTGYGFLDSLAHVFISYNFFFDGNKLFFLGMGKRHA
jgi:hypothetical protein